MSPPPRPTANQPLAGDEYFVELVAYTGRKQVRRFVLALGGMVSSVATGDVVGPSVGEAVVRRRADRCSVTRIDAGTEEEAALLLGHVRDQLATLTPEEFRERWNLDPEA